MADVFISYVRADRQIAAAISKELGALGISAFFDEENIVFGGDLKRQLEEHIQKSSLTIVIWSEKAAKSLFVREEIRVALEAWENERLFLVRFDNEELPVGLRDINCRDYSGMQPDEVAVSIASDVLKILSPLDFFCETGKASRPPRLEFPPATPFRTDGFRTAGFRVDAQTFPDMDKVFYRNLALNVGSGPLTVDCIGQRLFYRITRTTPEASASPRRRYFVDRHDCHNPHSVNSIFVNSSWACYLF